MSFSSKCSGFSQDKVSDCSIGSNQVKLVNVKESLGDQEKSRFGKPKAGETPSSPNRASGLKAAGIGLPQSSFKRGAGQLPKINTQV